MHDGTIRTLTDVMHVPTERRIRLEDDVLKMFNGDLVVMKGNTTNGSVYRLVDSVVVGEIHLWCLNFIAQLCVSIKFVYTE